MPGNDRLTQCGQFAFHHMQIGAANAASAHSQQDLSGAGLQVSESLQCGEAA